MSADLIHLDAAPSVQDAERGLLGVGVTGGGDLDALGATVSPSDFYTPVHEEIWAAILRVHESGTVPDPVTVRVELTRSAPNLRMDPMLLLELQQQAPLPVNASWYADLVLEYSLRRRLTRAAVQIKQLAESPSLSIGDTRERARAVIDEATDGRTESNLVRMPEVLATVLEVAENGVSPALATPWPDIDRLIGGLAPGRLVVVGARPGVGKSVMGTNLGLHFAENHAHAVLIASLEMSYAEVGQRLVSARARVDLGRLMSGTLTEPEWGKVSEHHNAINDLPIVIRDNPNQTITSIRADAREVRRTRPDLSVIVVDYLQLLKSGLKTSNRAEEVGHLSRGLKVLARETNTCVVAMAQLNREGAKNGDGRPRLTDLRESGAIEADADQVILLHRLDNELPDVEAIVDKNRHGPRGVAKLLMFGHYASLENAAWSPGTRGGA